MSRKADCRPGRCDSPIGLTFFHASQEEFLDPLERLGGRLPKFGVMGPHFQGGVHQQAALAFRDEQPSEGKSSPTTSRAAGLAAARVGVARTWQPKAHVTLPICSNMADSPNRPRFRPPLPGVCSRRRGASYTLSDIIGHRCVMGPNLEWMRRARNRCRSSPNNGHHTHEPDEGTIMRDNPSQTLLEVLGAMFRTSSPWVDTAGPRPCSTGCF
jgi:hypothetical protein